jgi:prepilin-type N-terminal cleavage/methylation domain-containing protein
MRCAARPGAFTLLESLIVIAIVATLIAVAVPGFQRGGRRARDECVSNLRNLGVALNLTLPTTTW